MLYFVDSTPDCWVSRQAVHPERRVMERLEAIEGELHFRDDPTAGGADSRAEARNGLALNETNGGVSVLSSSVFGE